jgi:predicted CopG family antitoxin
MKYRTINVRPSTYEKLVGYKNLGKSFDDVINRMMEQLDPVEMYEHVLDEHLSRVAEMKGGEYITLESLKKKSNEK